jgi:outer membrane biosynthesis protein TonB
MRMYRIELSPGEQSAFRSIEELAVAIRRGIVTPHARIWHNASSKWLPIQVHPHYKIAASMQLTSAELAAGAPVKPLELLTLGELMDPPTPPVRPVADPKPSIRSVVRPKEPARPTEPVKEIRAAQPEPPARKKRAAKPRRARSGRRPLRIALAGAILIGCAHLVFTAVSAAHSEEIAILPRTHRRLITAPASLAEQGRPETTAAAVLPSLPAVSLPRPIDSAGRQPSPTLPTESATSSLGASSGETTADIEPSPSAIQISAPTPVSTDSLVPRLVDSTGKKALKGVLRAIGGSPATERSRPKR